MQLGKVGSLTNLHFFGNNNGMVRPRKDKRMLMSVSIRIPLTEDQKRLIEEAASLDQSDMTAWVRPILVRAAQERLERNKEKVKHK
jgi:Protein of unknown function (DUF1778)